MTTKKKSGPARGPESGSVSGAAKPVNRFERKALKMLLAGDHPLLATLRLQLKGLRVTDRDFTEIGFFTYLQPEKSSPRIDVRTRLILCDVWADLVGLVSPCGLILYVEDGGLSGLECHTWAAEKFPSAPSLKRMYYSGGASVRDIQALHL